LKSKGDFSFDILEEVEYVFNNLWLNLWF
jgi:hypothetical protein